ncbi:MAG: hypothetical protein E5Y77_14965 [Mesorhizobium sp.]|nr:MAG: hypothetical protein E5Y77_14965 [Mesorhizobium sp.]
MIGRRDSTPLCPAGHLPRKGGDWQLRLRRLAAQTRSDLPCTVISTDRELATSAIAGLASSSAGQYILID